MLITLQVPFSRNVMVVRQPLWTISTGLRIDPAYLLGIAVFDTDHAYLLYVEINKKQRSDSTGKSCGDGSAV